MKVFFTPCGNIITLSYLLSSCNSQTNIYGKPLCDIKIITYSTLNHQVNETN